MNKRVIRDYLESLKEDNELDYIFPMLLQSMGYRIISTPKNSKGQSQYGKDIVAVGVDEKGCKCKWYFELKGASAKDINDSTFSVKDGVRDSILAAKYAAYNDSSIPGFNKLPKKIVFVHNGLLKENTRPTFDGFINEEFPNGGFERWDIEKLADLFHEFLFDECLYRNEESYRLVKKILALHDAPGWHTDDFDRLIDIQLQNCPSSKKQRRRITQAFSSIALILAMLFKEGSVNNNLLPSKRAADRAVLKTWEWVLRNKMENEGFINKLFYKILCIQLDIYTQYLNKVLPLAGQYKGLYMFNGFETERILYPLRCFDFIEDVVYYQVAVDSLFISADKRESFRKVSIGMIEQIINQNSGFDMPLLDTHSIPLLLVIYHIWKFSMHSEQEIAKIGNWIFRIASNIIIRKQDMDMFPELYSNSKELARSIFHKSSHYNDKSSLFLMTLIELLYCYGLEDSYKTIRSLILKSNTNLQVSYPIESDDLEISLFNHRLHKELSIQACISLPEELKDLPKTYKKEYNSIPLRTNSSHFPFLVLLAHIHYNTDWFPDFLDFGFLKPLDLKTRNNQ